MAAARLVKDMTVPGRIRALRIALRKAKHPLVDDYDATYLRYVVESFDTVPEAVDALFKLDGRKQKVK